MVIYETTAVLICLLPNSPSPPHEARACLECDRFRVAIRKYRQRNRGPDTACGRHPFARRLSRSDNTPYAGAERHAMTGYLAGVADATEGQDWCDDGRVLRQKYPCH
ncbi:hypothetical protein J8I33_05410 [Burkholderia sp. AcTa6-5]|nr:hypothetical protein [Burkholderia sp. AcTa6-5]